VRSLALHTARAVLAASRDSSDDPRDNVVRRSIERGHDDAEPGAHRDRSHVVTVWGVVPATGVGSRIQPIACSKELLPLGSRFEDGNELPRAISEYLLERMVLAGVQRICFVIAPGKSDIVEYYRDQFQGVPLCYAVQPRAHGLCDAIFRALPLVDLDDDVCVGLPDTLWFPTDALARLPRRAFSLLLFPCERPELFDAVVLDEHDRVRELHVKRRAPAVSTWIWGAFRLPGETLQQLERQWQERSCVDECFGTLVDDHVRRGAIVMGRRAGERYIDVGTVHGYREAARMLASRPPLRGRREERAR
jgi:dTDP-glucose pyrophosphorylase